MAFGILVLGVGCLTVFACGQDYIKLFTSFEMITYGYSLLGMFYACLLLIVITSREGFINVVMRNPLLRHFGIIAYGVFLMHMAINSLVNGLILGEEPGYFNSFSNVIPTVLAFLTTWFLVILSWRFIEKADNQLGPLLFSYSNKIVSPKP